MATYTSHFAPTPPDVVEKLYYTVGIKYLDSVRKIPSCARFPRICPRVIRAKDYTRVARCVRRRSTWMPFILARSSMSSSLGGSMGGSCLQQRAEGYPAYVFHEPLHSLTQSYSHAHSAHSQPHRGIPSHGGTPSTPGGQPAGPGGAPYQPTTSTATGEFAPLPQFTSSHSLSLPAKVTFK